MTALAAALERLVCAARPWPPALIAEIRADAERIGEDAATSGIEESPVVAAAVRAVANDLREVMTTPSAPPPPRVIRSRTLHKARCYLRR
jgi:hypothetical protein